MLGVRRTDGTEGRCTLEERRLPHPRRRRSYPWASRTSCMCGDRCRRQPVLVALVRRLESRLSSSSTGSIRAPKDAGTTTCASTKSTGELATFGQRIGDEMDTNAAALEDDGRDRELGCLPSSLDLASYVERQKSNKQRASNKAIIRRTCAAEPGIDPEAWRGAWSVDAAQSSVPSNSRSTGPLARVRLPRPLTVSVRRIDGHDRQHSRPRGMWYTR